MVRPIRSNQTLQRTAAPLGSRAAEAKSLSIREADRALPAAVAELSRSAMIAPNLKTQDELIDQ